MHQTWRDQFIDIFQTCATLKWRFDLKFEAKVKKPCFFLLKDRRISNIPRQLYVVQPEALTAWSEMQLKQRSSE